MRRFGADDLAMEMVATRDSLDVIKFQTENDKFVDRLMVITIFEQHC